VFKRLRVGQVDSDFVTRCLTSFNTAKREDIDNLAELVEKASKKTPDDLEKEENEDKAADTKKEERSGNHGSAEEKKMYDPLVCNTLRDFSLFL
jgi:DNA-binding transcriptional regulator GbsR (MarR family)